MRSPKLVASYDPKKSAAAFHSGTMETDLRHTKIHLREGALKNIPPTEANTI